jgi:hypothetical protein
VRCEYRSDSDARELDTALSRLPTVTVIEIELLQLQAINRHRDLHNYDISPVISERAPGQAPL